MLFHHFWYRKGSQNDPLTINKSIFFKLSNPSNPTNFTSGRKRAALSRSGRERAEAGGSGRKRAALSRSGRKRAEAGGIEQGRAEAGPRFISVFHCQAGGLLVESRELRAESRKPRAAS